MSFIARKNGLELEADFGLFFRTLDSAFPQLRPFFSECKTYNKFEARDMHRMSLLAEGFSGAILVFATLRNSFTEGEKRLLRLLVNRCQKYWKAERLFNPILLLTGTELFARWRPSQAWKEAGGIHAAVSERLRGWEDLLQLCGSTQQSYLNQATQHWDTPLV
jgi:hypothetical protein